MSNVLDRPVWHALTTRQTEFAMGGAFAKRFLPDVEPFAAAADDSAASHAALGDLVLADGITILLQVGETPPLPGTAVQVQALGVQMVAENVKPLAADDRVAKLGPADVPEMIALATLTKPGPFHARTHELGQFWGVKENGRLVAMAGERMKLPGYTEVSGVCTHPDVRGRGYAGLLSRVVANEIMNRGETPFLHAYAANTPAVELYKTLGFRLRTHVNVTVLTRG